MSARDARPPVLRIILRYVAGCPNWRLADERVRRALADIGGAAEIRHELVEGDEDVVRSAFHGSPTILVDGRDPFADETAPLGLACRIYVTEVGPQGAPSVTQLREALQGAA